MLPDKDRQTDRQPDGHVKRELGLGYFPAQNKPLQKLAF